MSFEHSNPFAGPSPATPPASESPLMVYGGQMWSREMAATKRAELMANSEYAQAALNGDIAKQTELKDLYMLERGLDPAPAPTNQVDVAAQMITQEQRDRAQHDAALRQQFDLSDEQRHTIIHQRPILQWEKDEIAQRHARNMQNEEFRQSLRNREPGAVRDEYIANWVRRAPLAHSLADIDAWHAHHPFLGTTGDGVGPDYPKKG